MIDRAVLYRIGVGCHAISIDIETIKPLEVHLVEQIDFIGIKTVDQDNLLKLGLLDSGSKGRYLLFNKDRIIAFEKLNMGLTLSQDLRDEVFEERTVRIVEQFRQKIWRQLIDCAYSISSGVEDVLKQLKINTFSDDYSLWLYNAHTRHFTLYCASFESDVDYLSSDNADATLNETLDESKQYICRRVRNKKINSNHLVDRVWLNRFIIKSGTGLVSVVTFYSKHDNFVFGEKISQLIPEIVSTKLDREFSPYLEKHLRVRDLTKNYSPGNLIQFLRSTLPMFSELIGWESMSVFISNETRELLTLTALAIDGKEYAVPDASYDLAKESLTVSVFSEATIYFSYDISNDPRNTHGFDEVTGRHPVNWVGVPVVRPQELPIGVLRVRNKLSSDGDVVPFNAFDIDLLQNIASVIAYLCHIEKTFQMRELSIKEHVSKQEAEYQQLSEFLKTFRHELKSPLTVVTQASNSIKRNVEYEKLPPKVKEILADLDMVGDRLMFVTSALTFEAQELVKDIKEVGLKKEIVAPILAFAMRYAKHRLRTINVDMNSLDHKVVCDAQAAAMVFHMLIDNAIKYSKIGTAILIRGVTTDKECSVLIESYGLPILADERKDIFRRYVRGHHAKQQKTDGSGIGLYLAQEIMKYNRGSLSLEKLSQPTIFKLSIERAQGGIK
jgi:signal transduction histidine kinase